MPPLTVHLVPVGDDISTATEATDVSAASCVSDIFAKYTVGIPALQLRAQTVAAQALMSTFTDSTRSYAEAALLQFRRQSRPRSRLMRHSDDQWNRVIRPDRMASAATCQPLRPSGHANAEISLIRPAT